MEKENARKQTLEQLHERRKQVVRLHKKGIKIMQIVEMTGLSTRWSDGAPATSFKQINRGAHWRVAQPSARRDDSADDY